MEDTGTHVEACGPLASAAAALAVGALTARLGDGVLMPLLCRLHSFPDGSGDGRQ
ncbi:hypothetical protein [Streptomyces noursei]|uniref:hypothetical protein n=1 Tax=Streptomyces noursei TaxID=1971 RepID=UPI003B8A6C67